MALFLLKSGQFRFTLKVTTMRKLLLILCLLGLSWPVDAARIPQAVQNALNRELSQSSIIQRKPSNITINPTKNPDVYQAIVGAYLFKIAADGKHVIRTTYNAAEWRNLSKKRQRSLRRHALETLDERGMIIFSPSKTRYTLTVFIDIDSQATARLHGEIKQLLAAGVRVRYVVFPRSGVGSDRYQRTVSVWCAPNRRVAVEMEIGGKKIKKRRCSHPLKAHYAVAHSINATVVTPTLIFESGDMHPGYMSAKSIVRKLKRGR